MRWGDFEQVAPEIAARAHGSFERFGFVLVGTVRRDGTPRICPVEVHVVRHQLMLVMIAGSHKAHDLARDPRLVLQTPVTNAGNPGCEIKLRGHVTDVDETQREATAASIEATSGWRPHDSWRFFTLTLDSASCIEWNEDEMTLKCWDQAHGLRPTARRRLDMETSRYVPIED